MGKSTLKEQTADNLHKVRNKLTLSPLDYKGAVTLVPDILKCLVSTPKIHNLLQVRSSVNTLPINNSVLEETNELWIFED